MVLTIRAHANDKCAERNRVLRELSLPPPPPRPTPTLRVGSFSPPARTEAAAVLTSQHSGRRVRKKPHPPIELPVPVDDIISDGGVTIIRSGVTLLACGDNMHRRITTANTPELTTPTPLDLPGPVVKVVMNRHSVFVQLTDGAWVGRGRYVVNVFIPLPGADLIDGRGRYPLLPGWTPLNDDYAAKMNARKVADVMVLSEPIANT